MEWFFIAVKALIVPIVAIVVGLVASGPITNLFAPLLARIGSTKEEGVGGRWRAVFYQGRQDEAFVEIIEISRFMGIQIGRVIPHPDNYADAKSVEDRRPVRIKGTLKDNMFFTGTWFHPSRRNHNVGGFQMILRRDSNRMEGMWVGYRESKNQIESGKWIWSRLDHKDSTASSRVRS